MRKKITPLPVLIVIALVLLILILVLDPKEATPEAEPEITATTVATAATVPYDDYTAAEDPLEKLELFAKMHDLPQDSWPDYMVELMQKNPDAESFVLNYPFLKGTLEEVDLSHLIGTGKVPKLYQWDHRWGYSMYGDKEMGLTACGPTCLSMVCMYYYQDATYTPRYVANLAQYFGYYTVGVGTEWSLMSEGARKLGLQVYTISPNATLVMESLKAGNLVILAMGPGVFTDNGHFILLTGVEDGLAVIHDPNSRTNSSQLWDLYSVADQIQNAWVFPPVA